LGDDHGWRIDKREGFREGFRFRVYVSRVDHRADRWVHHAKRTLLDACSPSSALGVAGHAHVTRSVLDPFAGNTLIGRDWRHDRVDLGGCDSAIAFDVPANKHTRV
jgi:hypothetical protein